MFYDLMWDKVNFALFSLYTKIWERYIFFTHPLTYIAEWIRLF